MEIERKLRKTDTSTDEEDVVMTFEVHGSHFLDDLWARRECMHAAQSNEKRFKRMSECMFQGMRSSLSREGESMINLAGSMLGLLMLARSCLGD
jgi:hypothetical protein